jgi:succinyl-diaminopimelate desuccinylase
LVDRVRARRDVDVQWTRIQTYAASSIPVDHPLAQVLRERSVAAVGDADLGADDVGAPWGIEAATDARNFCVDAGVPAVTWGPGNLDQAHAADESIDLAEAAVARDVLEATVRELIE